MNNKLVISVSALNKVQEYKQALETVFAAEPTMARAVLVPEPTNPYDAQAMQVYIEYQNQRTNQSGKALIGYVAKKDRERITQHLGPNFFSEQRAVKIYQWGYFTTASHESALMCELAVEF
jgi:hypothetical protein